MTKEKIPNLETQIAMENVRSGIGLRRTTLDELKSKFSDMADFDNTDLPEDSVNDCLMAMDEAEEMTSDKDIDLDKLGGALEEFSCIWDDYGRTIFYPILMAARAYLSEKRNHLIVGFKEFSIIEDENVPEGEIHINNIVYRRVTGNTDSAITVLEISDKTREEIERCLTITESALNGESQ